MKLLGVRADPLAAVRRRVALKAEAAAHAGGGASAASADSASFLGLSEADLTPPVQAALTTLLAEIDELRQEVGRLKGRLSEMEGLADRDALTPLLNRRAFMRELNRAAVFAQRYGGPASVVFFDLDGFKAVNDRFGHAAGDAALKAVAERLAANVRGSDVVGRLGGDEFGVILVQADAAAAKAKAAALAAAVEAGAAQGGGWAVPLHRRGGGRPVDPDLSPEQAVADADAAMYARKRGARRVAG